MSTRSNTVVNRRTCLVTAVMLTVAAPSFSEPPFVFDDVGQQAGVMRHVRGVRAHAAAFGDVNGDGWPDYFVGTFWLPGTTHNRLLINQGDGTFQRSEQPVLEQVGRATGAVFVDLDNDGDLDLYVSNNSRSNDQPHQNAPNRLFRNDGELRFTEIGPESGAIPSYYGSRDVIPLDYDGDGLLDLIIGGGAFDGHGREGLRLLHNLDGFRFEEVSARVGLPEGYRGSSGAVADVNNDGWPDLFFAGRNANRLMLNDGRGRFREAPGTAEVFHAALEQGGQAPTGVSFADLNRDGLLDLIVGQHTKHPWRSPVSPRIYLHRGIDSHRNPRFEDVTERTGIEPVPMKTPQIEVQDFDNDGRFDIFFSVVTFDSTSRAHPLIYRNVGVSDNGIPRYEQHALTVNDFPNEDDNSWTGSTTNFYNKMNRKRKITYAVAAPAADYDRDGRMDLFICEWWAENPSMLLRNVTRTGSHYLQVAVIGRAGVNRMGIGSKIYIYEAGRLGESDAMIAMRDITISQGYSSSQEALAHFGLGDRTHCDVRVVLPHGRGEIVRANVAVDQLLTLAQPAR